MKKVILTAALIISGLCTPAQADTVQRGTFTAAATPCVQGLDVQLERNANGQLTDTERTSVQNQAWTAFCGLSNWPTVDASHPYSADPIRFDRGTQDTADDVVVRWQIAPTPTH